MVGALEESEKDIVDRVREEEEGKLLSMTVLGVPLCKVLTLEKIKDKNEEILASLQSWTEFSD